MTRGGGARDVLDPWFNTALVARAPESLLAPAWTVILASLTLAACLSIAVTLLVFARRRRDLACRGLAVLAACFVPALGLVGLGGRVAAMAGPIAGPPWVVGATALMGLVLALLLWRALPKALGLPSPQALKAANASLAAEVAQRCAAERALRHANEELEGRVAARTAELAEANRALAVEAAERQRALDDRQRSVEELAFLLQAREELERGIAERTEALEAANARLAAEVEERGRVEVELRSTLGRLEGFISNTPLGVVEWIVPGGGADWIVDRWTGQAEALFGWSAAEAIGRGIGELGIVPEDREARSRLLRAQLVAAADPQSRVTAVNLTRSGERRTCAWYHSVLRERQGGVAHVLSLVEDVTDRVAALERAEWLASHDGLTGLPNRSLFRDRLVTSLAQARRRDEPIAVMMLDLDHFKEVNDTFGHQAGDALLVELSARLSRAMRETDTLARLGGDEFAVLQTGLVDTPGATALAERLLVCSRAPFRLGAHLVSTSLSIGIAISPDVGEEPELLLRSADEALYAVKRGGRSGWQLADPLTSGRLIEPLALG